MYIDPEGIVWVGAFQNLHRIDGDEWSSYNRATVTESDFPSGFIDGLAMDKTGALWIGSSNGEICRFDPTTELCTAYFKEAEGMATGPLTGLRTDDKERVYYSTESDGISVLEGETWRQLTTSDGYLAGNQVRDLAQDGGGMVWIATENGLQRSTRAPAWSISFSRPTIAGFPMST
ncbi:MAG: hypothetical protein HC802_14470 [Caldilineaceae bacterium]|nr:hypothetical protein [Caldilineaceae bacterium]